MSHNWWSYYATHQKGVYFTAKNVFTNNNKTEKPSPINFFGKKTFLLKVCRLKHGHFTTVSFRKLKKWLLTNIHMTKSSLKMLSNYILTSQPKTLVENDTELREIMRMRNLSTVAIENLQEKSQQKRLWQSLLEWSWRPTFYLNKKRARVNSSKSYFF